MGEDRIRLAARMYECRDAARLLFGDDYKTKMDTYHRVVRGVADKHCQGSEINAVTRIVTDAEAKGAGVDAVGSLTMFLTAAAVDLIEIKARGKVVEELIADVAGPAAGKARRRRG